MELLQSIDESMVLYVVSTLRCGALNIAMKVITMLGNGGAVWIVIGAALLLFKNHRKRGFAMLVCLALCAVVNNLVIKNIFARPRPFEVLGQLTILIKAPGGYSFPSGHASSSFTAAYALTKGYGKCGAWSYVLAALIAVSRVYVGVHFLSDIIAGAIVGTLCAWIVWKAFRRRLF